MFLIAPMDLRPIITHRPFADVEWIIYIDYPTAMG
jgi:hypothetical protein